MNTMTPDQIKLRNHILQACVDRIDSTRGRPDKGKPAGAKREEAALDYLCGATTALKLVDNETANNLEMLIAYVFCVRGSYSESRHMLEEAAEKEIV